MRLAANERLLRYAIGRGKRRKFHDESRERPTTGMRKTAVLELFAGIVVLLNFSSCAWQVIPPTEVREPVPVFLSEYGRHTRLALPNDSQLFFEYGFGEWNFYGLEKQGVFSALRAISGGGEGAFSRRKLPFALDEVDFRYAAGGDRAARMWVERSLADNLRHELEGRWRANAASVVIRQLDQVPVSRDPTPYHLFGNSNHAVANWLKRLGCRVHGAPITSNFEIKKWSGGEYQAHQPRDGATP
jgi:hypothetical protein